MLSSPRTFLSALLLLAALGLHAAELTGRVVGLSDGDTITVLDAEHVQHKIRLSGIDAPEKAQPLGTVSAQGCPFFGD